MSKKILIVILGMILFVVLVAIFVYIGTNNRSKEKIASEIFGNESCEVILHMATKDLVNHTCKVCGKEFQDSSMREDICNECAKQTGRCEFCGKKLSEQVQQERQKILNTTSEE